MREIFFRGKRVDNGEWVYGAYSAYDVKYDYDSEEFETELVFAPSIIAYDDGCLWYCVDPATVGQYTGLTDENGKRIFEGDIVKHYNRMDDPDSYESGIVFWDAGTACFKRTSPSGFSFVGSHCRYEIIGNIYDNLELLGVNDG